MKMLNQLNQLPDYELITQANAIDTSLKSNGVPLDELFILQMMDTELDNRYLEIAEELESIRQIELLSAEIKH